MLKKHLINKKHFFIIYILLNLFVFHHTSHLCAAETKKSAAYNNEIDKKIKNILTNEGMDVKYHDQVASSLLNNSKEMSIPIPVMLSLMKYESYFNVNVVSECGAVGLMQIHPITWDYYVKRMNLNVSKEAIFDPTLNIKVAANILYDLRKRYSAIGYKENIVWDYVFSAYFKGIGSVKNGLKPSHKKYSGLIKKKAVEYERSLFNTEHLKIKMAI